MIIIRSPIILNAYFRIMAWVFADVLFSEILSIHIVINYFYVDLADYINFQKMSYESS